MAARRKRASARVLIDGAKRAPAIKDEASALGLSDEALERELGPDVEEPTAKELSPAVLPGLPEAAVEGATRFTVVKGKSVSCRNSVKVGEIKASDVIGGEATLLDLESRGLVVRE